MTIAQEFNKKINKCSIIDERTYWINEASKKIKFDAGEKHKQIFVFFDNSKLEIFTKSKKTRVLK